MRIDYEAIGQGIYDMMPENDKAVVAFGMMPKKFMDLAVEEFKAKIIRIAAEQLSIPEEDASNVLRPKKEVVRNFEHNLCLAILGAAKSAGKLVV